MEIFLFLIAFLVVDVALCAVLAAGAGLVLGRSTAFFTRHVAEGRREAVHAARWLPFKCFMWVVLVFLAYRVINVNVRHNIDIRGDAWTCLLPNGYGLLMIDWTNSGWVYDTRIHGLGVFDGIGDQQGSVGGVRLVQIAGQYVLGGSDSQVGDHAGTDSNSVDTYFVLDTQTGKRTNLPSYGALRDVAAGLGIPLKLERIYEVYKRYRFTWFDFAFASLASILPLVLGWRLLDRIMRLRNIRGNIEKPHEQLV